MLKKHTLLAIIFTSILIIVAKWYLAPETTFTGSIAMCDFEQQNCTVSLEGNQYILTANPSRVVSEAELQFQLTSNVQEYSINSAKLEGKDMFMGIIPVFFKKSQDDQYTANTMLGACMDDKMLWRMTINLNVNGESKDIKFDFYSYQQ